MTRSIKKYFVPTLAIIAFVVLLGTLGYFGSLSEGPRYDCGSGYDAPVERCELVKG